MHRDKKKANLYYMTRLPGVILGLIYITIAFWGKSEGDKPNIQITIGNFIRNGHFYLFNRHIHHWMIFMIVAITISILNLNKFFSIYLDYLMGFSVVMILHGLSYFDRFVTNN